MCSHLTHFRAMTVIGETDGASARPAHSTKLEDQLMARLAGKVAVITGGGSGIGLATAEVCRRRRPCLHHGPSAQRAGQGQGADR